MINYIFGDLSMFLRGSGSVRVEARTKKSDRFLFHLEPNTIFAFSKMRVVLALSSTGCPYKKYTHPFIHIIAKLLNISEKDKCLWKG